MKEDFKNLSNPGLFTKKQAVAIKRNEPVSAISVLGKAGLLPRPSHRTVRTDLVHGSCILYPLAIRGKNARFNCFQIKQLLLIEPAVR